MQQKKHSALESITNVLAGYGVAIASQVIIFPWFGIHVPLRTNLWIGAWFTVISLGRSYCLRRIFTRLTENLQPSTNPERSKKWMSNTARKETASSPMP